MSRFFRTLTVLLMIACFGLTGANPPDNDAAATLRQRLTAWFESHPTGRLYIQVDKPMYQPGETIWFRTTLFATDTLAQYEGELGIDCQLVDPRGAPVVRKRVKMSGGSAANDIVIPAGVTGGEFTLKVSSDVGPVEERPIVIHAYQAPLIQKKLKVLGKGYGPGDRVEAEAEFRQGTGEALAGHPVIGLVRVDGKQVQRLELTTDETGNLTVSFDLPATVETEDALLTLQVSAGGITESISRTIPILLSRLNVDFYPEGGDLVVGLPSRVYFQAWKPNGKPAEVAGRVVDEQGREVARLSSVHHGMGRFTLTPQAGMHYTLEVERPAGVKGTYRLPVAQEGGVVMRLEDDLGGKRSDVRLTLHAIEALDNVIVVAALRERVVALRRVDLRPGANPVVLYPKSGQGVMRLTVLTGDGVPLCERVAYRQAGHDLQVSIQPERDHYMPREKVNLIIRTTLPDGTPVPAELALGVVDDRVLTFADDKTAHLLTHLYLEKDLPGEIEEPNFYLDPSEERAPLALDLLMGTRGWRRFEWKRLAEPDAFGDIRITDQIIQQVTRTAATQALPRPAPPMMAVAVPEEIEDVKRDVPEALDQPVDAAAPPAPVKKLAELNEPVVAAKAMKPAAEPQPELPKAQVMAEEMAEEEMADLDWAGRRERRQLQHAWAVVREFPVVRYDSTETEVRTDFRETIYWQPMVSTDEHGQARVSFWLNDAVTAFRVTAEGTARQGLPGRTELVIDSRTPIHAEAKLPVVLSAGDRLDLPMRLTNETDRELLIHGGIELPAGMRALQKAYELGAVQLAAGEARTLYLPMQAESGAFDGELRYWVKAAGLSENVKRRLRIEPVGFPMQHDESDSLKDTKSIRLALPAGIVPGSLTATLKLYPSPMATMLDGLESLLREPSGCFEQTSSTTYPNIMVLSYLQTTDTAAPDIEQRATDLIAKGYQRLIGYETPKQGYEWFGGAPGHEALTAYGIMEFIDMAKVYDKVDPEMIKRTVQWMMAQRDGEGGFKRNPRALDSFGRADEDVTTAYIVWALTEAGIEGIDRELEAVTLNAYESKNAYLLALASLAQSTRDPKSAEAKELAGQVLLAKAEDGHFEGQGRSITGTSGKYLHMETTALAMLALLRSGQPAASLNATVQWLIAQRQGGGFGPTQTTILCLKALTEYAQASRVTTSDGDIVIRVNGNLVARRHFNKGEQGIIEIDGFEELLSEGDNHIDLQLISDMELPYNLSVGYKTTTPKADDACPVRLETRLESNDVAMGDAVMLHATLTNVTDDGQAMTLARIGIPAGLQAQTWQLKELRENGAFDFYETTEREVILYWRSLAPNAEKQVSLALTADLPGRFTGIASSAYPYYTPNHKWWNQPLSLDIATP